LALGGPGGSGALLALKQKAARLDHSFSPVMAKWSAAYKAKTGKRQAIIGRSALGNRFDQENRRPTFRASDYAAKAGRLDKLGLRNSRW